MSMDTNQEFRTIAVSNTCVSLHSILTKVNPMAKAATKTKAAAKKAAPAKKPAEKKAAKPKKK